VLLVTAHHDKAYDRPCHLCGRAHTSQQGLMGALSAEDTCISINQGALCSGACCCAQAVH
jgi:hypothetical protein